MTLAQLRMALQQLLMTIQQLQQSLPVPETGILREVRRSKGDIVTSGDLLAVIETGAGEQPVATAEPAPDDPPDE